MDERLRDALELLRQGDVEQAWLGCQPLLQAATADFDTLNALGTVALRAGHTEHGVDFLSQAIRKSPTVARVHLNLGSGLHRLGRLEEAVASYDRAIALRPTMAEAHNNRGAAVQDLGRYAEALADFDRAVAANPDYADAWLNRSSALRKLDRIDEALAACERAVALAPQSIKARMANGRILHGMRRLPDALAAFDATIAMAPDLAAAHDGRAGVLVELGQMADALAACDRSIALRPADLEAHCRRTDLLWDMGRIEEAQVECERVIELDPHFRFVAGLRVHMKMKICDWDGIEGDVRKLEQSVERGEKVSRPLPFLAACTAPAIQRRCAETEAAEHIEGPSPPSARPSPPHDRIRVGYFGGIFCDHPTAFLIVESLEKHDAAKFELTAFSFSPDYGAEIRQRFNAAFERFIDVRGMSDAAISALARQMEIDVAVDLNGWTKDARPRIFVLRAAPIQVNYLGYPGTMGAAYMDYLIADPILIPETDRRYYREKIVTLPDTYQPNDTKRTIAGRGPSRREMGLPDTGFVYCCFNNTFKITPEVFACWMRILRQADDLVLWLLEDNTSATGNLRRAAASSGIDPTRLVFAPRVPFADHLARQRHADLFLDTAPYGAHTTASDALWVGLPVLTTYGSTFAARVAASLLTALDMPELIAPTLADYEARAVYHAHHRDELRALRDKLDSKRQTARLFDIVRYTRHLEAAYTAMYQRYRAGLPPDHIVIAPVD